MELTAGCLFSGMGGFAQGLSEAGFTIKWANDADESACKTFQHRFPESRVIKKDVCDLHVKADRLEPVDILSGGFPCQSFSQAGNREGFEDPRGEVFFEIPRLIKDWEPENRPALVILENVPHFLSGNGGAWFDEARRALRKAGYWFRAESCWTVNVKDVTDLPQDRERLFMVAASKHRFTRNLFSPPVLEQPDRIDLENILDRSRKGMESAYLPPENRYCKMIEEEMNDGESKRNIYQLRRSYVREKLDGLCPTLTANMGGGGHNVPFILDEWGIRRLSVEEVARLQGITANGRSPLFPDIPEKDQYRLLGNAVCSKLAYLAGRECAGILNGRSVNG